MSRMQKAMLAATMLVLAAAARGADIYVISHSGVTVTPADVRDVFLGDKQMAGGTRLVPVDNSAVQAAFLEKVVRMDAGKYSTSWTKKSFRDGLQPPAVRPGDAATVDFVRQTPGAVGYVGAAPTGVTVIGKF